MARGRRRRRHGIVTLTIKSHPESPGSSVGDASSWTRRDLRIYQSLLHLYGNFEVGGGVPRNSIFDAMEARAALAAVFVVCLAVCSTVTPVTSARSADDDTGSSRQDEGRSSLEGEVRWLKEKTAELATVAERLKAEMASKVNTPFDLIKKPKVNKRHCWDVADVCCMWNIC